MNRPTKRVTRLDDNRIMREKLNSLFDLALNDREILKAINRNSLTIFKMTDSLMMGTLNYYNPMSERYVLVDYSKDAVRYKSVTIIMRLIKSRIMSVTDRLDLESM